MEDVVLGLDVGTTSVKGCLLTAAGEVVAQASSQPYAIRRPHPGWAEQDPADWWHAVCTVIRSLGAQVAGTEHIVALGVSGQGCAVTLIDAEGAPLRPSLIWMDQRAAAETARLAQEHAATLVHLNGNAAGVYNVEPKLLWLREHEPTLYTRACHTLTTTAYVVLQLTQRAVMNVADGGILFAFDATQEDWNTSFLADLGLRADLYPPLAPCAAVIGHVTDAAARACGLKAGIPVVAGGEDSPAAALSVGVCTPGDAFLSLGTAAVVGICVDAATPLHEPRLLTYPHVLPRQRIVSGSMSSAGASVEWLLREFGSAYGPTAELNTAFNAAIAASPPGGQGLLFLPYLSGELHPILDAQARGVFFGLTPATTRADMARAIVEGSAMAIRHNIEVAAAAGAPMTHLWATGGPTRSGPWCQAIADITGQPLTVTRGGGAPIGDALLAGAGVNLIADIAQVARSRIVVEHTYVPQPLHQARYDALYAIYLRLYPQLAAEFAALAAWS